MKVLAFNGSPHKDGSTYTAINIVSEELKNFDINVEIVQVGSKIIRGCIGCYKCRELKKCFYNDDIVNENLANIQDADGLILGSPVYYSGIAGTMKCFLDRLFFAGPDLRYKVGAAVLALRRSGGVSAFQQINNYFNLAQMIIAPSQYWNVIHGTNSEEVIKDEEGVQILRTLGKNMGWLLKSLHSGRNEITEPVQSQKVRTNFIR